MAGMITNISGKRAIKNTQLLLATHIPSFFNYQKIGFFSTPHVKVLERKNIGGLIIPINLGAVGPSQIQNQLRELHGNIGLKWVIFDHYHSHLTTEVLFDLFRAILHKSRNYDLKDSVHGIRFQKRSQHFPVSLTLEDKQLLISELFLNQWIPESEDAEEQAARELAKETLNMVLEDRF